jgi:ProP effector
MPEVSTQPDASPSEAPAAPVPVTDVSTAEQRDDPAPTPPCASGAEEVADSAPAAPALPELSPAACATRLAELFPAVFTPQLPKPLKLRIQADLQQRAPGIFTRKALSTFLHRHTTSTAYLRALANAPHRFDLDGAPAGEVAAEHRDAALAELQRRRTLHEERRVAEREAQRAAERAAYQAARREQVAQDEQRRDMLALLRAFESSTLTKANFCALKGLSEAELDARLALARQLPSTVQRPELDASDRPMPGRPAGRRPDHPPRHPDSEPRSRAQPMRKRP